MIVNVEQDLEKFIIESKLIDNIDSLQLPNISLDSENIKVIMINEVTPQNCDDFFYSKSEQPDYMRTTLALFKNAGIEVNSIQDIINMGIYITTAVKCSKSEYSVDSNVIKMHALILEEELKLYPNLSAIMLMGDVAKKAFNIIAKKNTKKNVIPSEATYKIRKNKYFYHDIRVFPSYIMTGGNILIEKSKREMITDDIREMINLIKNGQKK
jgi:uracil-DNA glycosylase